MSEVVENVVRVSRVIDAPASEIFAVLVEPSRHAEFDGSDMLRGSEHPTLTWVDDVFLMNMEYVEFGNYVMANRVTEFVLNERIGWAPSRHDQEGSSWNHRWIYELESQGPSRTLVSELYDATRMPDDGLRITKHGATWAERMAASLELLATLVESRP